RYETSHAEAHGLFYAESLSFFTLVTRRYSDLPPVCGLADQRMIVIHVPLHRRHAVVPVRRIFTLSKWRYPRSRIRHKQLHLKRAYSSELPPLMVNNERLKPGKKTRFANHTVLHRAGKFLQRN
ncbi:MAG TPA: hypothetical protein VGQ61_06325, partial [Candidatus Angelobacter sp.]|nr:hypothetical protein [Candidatus Angelobacter sp.]